MHLKAGTGDNRVSMSEEEVPAGPPAWPGGARWTSAPPPTPTWWPQTFYTYEPPPPPRRTSRLLMVGVAVVIFVFAASAAATAVIATRGLGGSGSTAGVQAAVVDVDTSLSDGAAAAGTGIVLTSSGVVLTNFHVVDGEQGISIRITSTGETYPANEIGGDSVHDVAVLQIEGASGLATAPLGNSSNVHIGDSVTALGNAEGRGGSPAVVTGQVTALGQTITASDETGGSPETLNGMIQTNAPIQPGDSGGPLINSNGQVVGMDTAASGGRRGPDPGAIESFAIPINTALNYAHQLLVHPAAPPSGAYLGVCAEDDTSQAGALVAVGCGAATGVVSGSPAAAAGLAAGDVIIELGGNAVTSQASLALLLQGDHAGQSVSLVWLDRGGGRHQATVVLTASPPQ
jgi:S1-C subfamily serine protease